MSHNDFIVLLLIVLISCYLTLVCSLSVKLYEAWVKQKRKSKEANHVTEVTQSFNDIRYQVSNLKNTLMEIEHFGAGK